MPSAYLALQDLDTYGLSNNGATTALIGKASAMVDAYLRRPKGLVYLTDANGFPCAMAAATAEVTFKLVGSIPAGQNVQAQLAPAMITPDMVGDVLVLDAGNPALIEACQVIATSGGTVTLGHVQFAHSSGATAQIGLTLTEERALPNKRSVTQVAQMPAVRLISLLGRYAYGRRSEQVGGLFQEMNLLASVQAFGGPPQWIIVDMTQASISPVTGEVWVPAGQLLAYYSEVRIRYIAGCPANAIPAPVKQATADLINALSQTGGIPAGVKKMQAGTTTIERWAATNFDADTKIQLEPFKARVFY